LPKLKDKALHIKIGTRIQEIRKEKKLEQQDLAANCAYDKSYLSRIESGKTDARISTYSKIAEGLGVELSELFNF